MCSMLLMSLVSFFIEVVIRCSWCSFYRYQLNALYFPATALGTEDIGVNKID